jgi:hypothetical protein
MKDINRALASGYYNGHIRFPTKRYLLTYRCSHCGLEYQEVDTIKQETSKCRNGCTDFSWGRFLIGLITRKGFYGAGELIKAEDFPPAY